MGDGRAPGIFSARGTFPRGTRIFFRKKLQFTFSEIQGMRLKEVGPLVTKAKKMDAIVSASLVKIAVQEQAA